MIFYALFKRNRKKSFFGWKPLTSHVLQAEGQSVCGDHRGECGV